MAKVVTTKELKNKIDNDEDFYLVDVLSQDSYSGRHIPKAVNLPNSTSNFAEELSKKTGAQKDDEIIVYCSSETCQASPNAAKKLEEAGFTNVAHYKSGLAGWQEEGYEFEGNTEE